MKNFNKKGLTNICKATKILNRNKNTKKLDIRYIIFKNKLITFNLPRFEI